MFLKFSQNSQENTCARASLLRPTSLLKRRLWHMCFPVSFVKLLRTPFLQNTSGRLVLNHNSTVLWFIRVNNARHIFSQTFVYVDKRLLSCYLLCRTSVGKRRDNIFNGIYEICLIVLNSHYTITWSKGEKVGNSKVAKNIKQRRIQRFWKGVALHVGHHGWPTKKSLGFRWFKKTKKTLETISFRQNIFISIFKFSQFLYTIKASEWNLIKFQNLQTLW